MKFVIRTASNKSVVAETLNISTLKDLKNLQEKYGGHSLVIDFTRDWIGNTLKQSVEGTPSIMIYDDHLE